MGLQGKATKFHETAADERERIISEPAIVQSESIVECPVCREYFRSPAFPRPTSDAFAIVPFHSIEDARGFKVACVGSGMQVAR